MYLIFLLFFLYINKKKIIFKDEIDLIDLNFLCYLKEKIV